MEQVEAQLAEINQERISLEAQLKQALSQLQNSKDHENEEVLKSQARIQILESTLREKELEAGKMR